MNLAADQVVREYNTDSAGNVWRAATDVKSDEGTDALLRDWVQQLGIDMPAFASRDLRVGVATKTILESTQQAGLFQLTVEIGLQLESHSLKRIDEAEIDHDSNNLTANGHIDPIAPIGRGLPRKVGHVSKSL